jgi:hypothetical protein
LGSFEVGAQDFGQALAAANAGRSKDWDAEIGSA